jgi:hypothetical protein
MRVVHFPGLTYLAQQSSSVQRRKIRSPECSAIYVLGFLVPSSEREQIPFPFVKLCDLHVPPPHFPEGIDRCLVEDDCFAVGVDLPGVLGSLLEVPSRFLLEPCPALDEIPPSLILTRRLGQVAAFSGTVPSRASILSLA